MYADDVQIHLSYKIGMVEDATARINEDLMGINQWSRENRLKLNSKKCQAIVISNTAIDTSYFPSVELERKTLNYVKTVKNLGVIFNQTLSWDDHLNCAVGRIYSALRVLYISASCLPLSTKMTIAKTLVLPTLFYGSPIFCALDSANKRKLQVVFNNVVRFVYDLRRFDHVSVEASSVYNMTFNRYMDYQTLTFLFRLIHTRSPEYLFEKLSFPVSQRSNILIVPTYKFRNSKQQFFVHAVALWNSLPSNLRGIHSNTRFENCLKDLYKC